MLMSEVGLVIFDRSLGDRHCFRCFLHWPLNFGILKLLLSRLLYDLLCEHLRSNSRSEILTFARIVREVYSGLHGAIGRDTVLAVSQLELVLPLGNLHLLADYFPLLFLDHSSFLIKFA